MHRVSWMHSGVTLRLEEYGLRTDWRAKICAATLTSRFTWMKESQEFVLDLSWYHRLYSLPSSSCTRPTCTVSMKQANRTPGSSACETSNKPGMSFDNLEPSQIYCLGEDSSQPGQYQVPNSTGVGASDEPTSAVLFRHCAYQALRDVYALSWSSTLLNDYHPCWCLSFSQPSFLLPDAWFVGWQKGDLNLGWSRGILLPLLRTGFGALPLPQQLLALWSLRQAHWIQINRSRSGLWLEDCSICIDQYGTYWLWNPSM